MKKGNAEKGFTLVEVMMVVGVSVFIGLSLFMALRVGETHTRAAELKMTIQESAREGLDRMIQEIRQSAPDRIQIGEFNESIQLRVPLAEDIDDESYIIDWDGASLIRYAVGDGGTHLIRTNLNTGAESVVANDVTAVEFDGNADDPTVVTITISVQKTLVNGRVMPENPLQMTAQAEVRNPVS